MTCDACTLAEAGELTGMYQHDCDGCKARSIAQGIDLFNAKKAGHMTPVYQDALKRVFGDQWEQGHELVKGWAKKLKNGDSSESAKT